MNYCTEKKFVDYRGNPIHKRIPPLQFSNLRTIGGFILLEKWREQLSKIMKSI